MRMTHMDLFTGIGGNTLAAQFAGFETVAHSEIDPFCAELTGLHFPHVPNLGDITKITDEQLEPFRGRITVISTGSPCQDISAAGRGAGLDGAKSKLWYDALRVIGVVRPRWTLIENSPLLRVRGADTIIEGMEGIGYACWPFVVGAEDAGAPHRRQRAFIVCWRGDGEGDELGDPGIGGQSRHCQRRKPAGSQFADGYTGNETLADADSTNAREQRERKRIEAAYPLPGCASFVGDAPSRENDRRKRSDLDGSQESRESFDDAFDVAGEGELDDSNSFRQCECHRSASVESGDRQDDRIPEPASCIVADPHYGRIRRRLRGQKRVEGNGTRPPFRIRNVRFAQCRLGRSATGLSCRLDRPPWPSGKGEEQYAWEPRRTCGATPMRSARLKALGNAVVPAQVLPFYQTIYAIETGGMVVDGFGDVHTRGQRG